jgi:hypothetical protein
MTPHTSEREANHPAGPGPLTSKSSHPVSAGSNRTIRCGVHAAPPTCRPHRRVAGADMSESEETHLRLFAPNNICRSSLGRLPFRLLGDNAHYVVGWHGGHARELEPFIKQCKLKTTHHVVRCWGATGDSPLCTRAQGLLEQVRLTQMAAEAHAERAQEG